jgi:hypothetical protein
MKPARERERRYLIAARYHAWAATRSSVASRATLEAIYREARLAARAVFKIRPDLKVGSDGRR